MFRFDKKQEVFKVGDVHFGGQPGEYPTVLVGTMFYNRHKIVTDEEKGEFDKEAAEELWKTQEEMGDITGNPYVNQIVGETKEAIRNYIDWFVEVDDSTPFLIDSSDGSVRAEAARYVTEIGVADRAIHNSINASIHEDEIEAVSQSDMEASIVLAFNATDPSVKGKMDILEEGGGGIEKGLLEIARESGITKPLVDVAATPLGAGAGASMRSVTTVKGHLGLPAGGGYHNMSSAWDWMKQFKKEHKEAYMPADVGTNLVAQTLGSNFQLYGPIENAKTVFPATAMVDIILGENAKELGVELAMEEHPLYKLV
ncbi:tetrahydromethanopterin S-methyltransferase subunit H [Methanohalobium sp.]|uniref:tetrahydromethanopterin S-methyltransferase subunit H n=1 Tax=Methanohalobium sp. TaxID=2837493 RepID=UPI0025EBA7B0|nr:tetrahydromethanopterin S-methyltransferase subunit H [Methanohalobium sp.]